MAKEKFKAAKPPFKHRRCAFNQKHIHPPTGGNFTSGAYAERLHKRAKRTTSSAVALRAMAGQASKASLEFGEDVKKRLRLLSEELLLA